MLKKYNYFSFIEILFDVIQEICIIFFPMFITIPENLYYIKLFMQKGRINRSTVTQNTMINKYVEDYIKFL